MSMPIEEWLAQIGLAQYGPAFVEADVEFDTLEDLTEPDLAHLGVSLGHRKRMLRAIAAQRALPVDPTVAESLANSEAIAKATGERRQLTIIFCDLVGSTALAATLDAEDVRIVMSEYHKCAATIVAGHGGEVVQFLGDGVMAEFGYPRAHEDDAARAVRCALELITAVRDTEFSGGVRLQTRVGIATGTEVVGHGTDGTLGRASSVGATPSLSARVQNVAETNTAAIAPSTRRLLGDTFVLTSLGTHELKGVDGETELWRVDGETVGASRFAAQHSGASSHFVGRELESALLQHRSRLAIAGEGQTVLLTADAGIGKSRIVENFLDSDDASGFRRVRFQCSQHRTASALHPVSEYVQNVAGFVAEDTAAERSAKLESLCAREIPAQPGAVDALALLVGIPGAVDRPAIAALDTDQRKALIFRTLNGALTSLASATPLLVIVEDLHWIDPSTLDLVTQIIEAAQKQRTFVIATARPEFASPWKHVDHITTLAINRLERSAVEVMVRELCAGRDVPDATIDRIVERTDGVPLFVEELTKTILESGGTSAAAIPETLRDVLAARLDTRVSVRDVAQAGAVIGRDFSRAMVAAISAANPASLDHALDQLVETGLVLRRAGTRDAEYSFKHALVRDAAYDMLLRSQRQQLHLRAADALIAAVEAEPEMVAHHFEEGGARDKALGYWHLAADSALARSAYREASVQLRRALALISSVATGSDAVELDLRNQLGTVYFVIEGGSSKTALEIYERAWAIAGSLPESRMTFAALWGLCFCYYIGGRVIESRPMATTLLEIAERIGDEDLILEALHANWAAAFSMGDLTLAIGMARRANEIYDAERHHRHVTKFGSGHDSGMCALGHGGVALLLTGQVAEGRRWLDRAGALLGRLKHPNTMCSGQTFIAVGHGLLGEYDAAVASANEILEVARERNFLMPIAFSTMVVGDARLGRGEVQSGAELMASIAEQKLKALPAAWRPYYLSRLALAELELGDPDSAAARLDLAHACSLESGGCYSAPELPRVAAILAGARGAPFAEIDALLNQAVAKARENGTIFLELRAHLDRMELAEATGNGTADDSRQAALALLPRIDGGEDAVDVRRAHAMLDAVRHAPSA